MENIELKTTINISNAGKNTSIRLGDVDGDGRMELVIAKVDAVSDERYFSHQVVALTVFTVDGELLWQLGDPSYESPCKECEVPLQIYDIDKDGKNEIIVIMNGELLILDGKTSEIKNSVPLPDQYACDSIVIADLEGSGYAQNLLIKNKFSKLWALDINLNTIWTFEGNIGHCPVVFDINGDGKDEIIAGYNVLNGFGELLWKANMPAHANSILVDDIYKDGEYTIIFCGPKIRAYTTDGECLWELDEKCENAVCGIFRDNTGQKDLLLLDTLSLYDLSGSFLYRKNETVYLPTLVHNFDASGKTYIVGHKKEDIQTTLYDGYMRACYLLPTFGKIVCGDILGDGVSQVIIYNDETADIYSCKETDLSTPARPYPLMQQKQFYNISIHNTLPLSQLSAGYAIADFASQNILKWAETYSNLNMHNSYSKVTRSEFVLLIATLLNLKEDFSENFADVSKESSYFDAVGTFKKLGIIESSDNMFRPNDNITTQFANIILEKLSIGLLFNFDSNYELSKQDTAKLLLTINSQN